MGEQEFRQECDSVLCAIEDALDATGIDVDTERNEAVLQIELANGTKVIVSGNTPVREIWLAAKSGGFHYRNVDGKWLDSRSGEELFAGLSRCVSAQSGEMVILARR